jgi:hypothetical protein
MPLSPGFHNPDTSQDAHELLNYLLNQGAEILEEQIKGEHSAKGLPPPQTPIVTWIHDIFQGTLVNETRCLHCETVTCREEVFMDLSLEIEQNCSVTSCLRNFRYIGQHVREMALCIVRVHVIRPIAAFGLTVAGYVDVDLSCWVQVGSGEHQMYCTHKLLSAPAISSRLTRLSPCMTLMHDLMHDPSAMEMLNCEDKFFCDQCCCLQEAQKRMLIKRAPPCLILHLKRFKYVEAQGRHVACVCVCLLCGMCVWRGVHLLLSGKWCRAWKAGRPLSPAWTLLAVSCTFHFSRQPMIGTWACKRVIPRPPGSNSRCAHACVGAACVLTFDSLVTTVAV